jgi:putative membrane protein
VNREVQGVVQVLIGGAVLRASLTDLYLRYVRSGLRPFLVVAGVVLVVAGLATLWYEFRRGRGSRRNRDALPHHEPRIAWLLLLPLFALIIVGPPALGSYAADRNGTALQRPPGFDPLPAGDPLRLDVLDYATRAVYDHGNGLGNRRIKLVGFLTIGHTGTPYLTRMVMSCCAADALPIKVGLSGKLPTNLKPNAWLEVTGHYTNRQLTDEANKGTIPFIDITEVSPVPAPRQPYEG